MTTQEQLQQQCEQIAEEISNPIVITEDNVDEYEDVVIGDEVSVYNYLENNFGMDFTVGLSDGGLQYQSGSVLMACGGPSISIETNAVNNRVKVHGNWWGDEIIVEAVDNLGIDEYLEEIYNMYKDR